MITELLKWTVLILAYRCAEFVKYKVHAKRGDHKTVILIVDGILMGICEAVVLYTNRFNDEKSELKLIINCIPIARQIL